MTTPFTPGPRNLISDVAGVKVGNAEDRDVRTGVTAVLPDVRAVCAVDVRGGGPGTRETDALSADCLVDAVDAIVLSGGSVYGLDAASGVTGWLGARGRGFELRGAPHVAPIVPAAILFDLTNGGDKEWGELPPYNALGRAAAATATDDFALGNAGAGLGAKAGSLKGGLGSASAHAPGGFMVGALAAVNPHGSVVMPGSSRFWAAPFELAKELGGQDARAPAKPLETFDPFAGSKMGASPGMNTTIGVVATDAALTPSEAKRLAMMAQDGYARAIRPVHTPFDGDVVFALSTGAKPLGEARAPMLAALGALAADCMARAVARGVYEAETLGDAESYRSCFGLA